MTTPEAILDVRDLWLDYRQGRGWVNALRGIHLTIAPGEVHGLVGESGSGKSTLALAVMGYFAPNARIARGSIVFDGRDLVALPESERRPLWGAQIALVPQDALAALNPAYPIGDQIAEVYRQHHRLPHRAARARAVEMLHAVHIADAERVARRYPHQLSGGMQQRVVIAMALAARPRLLILDEPTTALDVTTQAVILDLVRELIHETGAAALYVSHDLGLIARLCQRVTVLYGGEVMEADRAARLYHHPSHPYTIGLLASLPRPVQGREVRLPTIDGAAPALADRPAGCVFAARCPAVVDRCHTVKPPLEAIEPGRWINCHRWREIASGGLTIAAAPIAASADAGLPVSDGYVLETRGLTKIYDPPSRLEALLGRRDPGVRALVDGSIRIRARSTLGLVGESGSGKTTLARLIVGLETADEGEMELLNVPLPRRLSARSRDQLRELQMVFQNPNDALNPFRTIGAALARTIRRLDPKADRETLDTRVADLLRMVRLPLEYAKRYPAELSGGEKQRVAIARAFAADPALVIADEPTSALDVSVQAVILNLLKDMRAARGASYLFISHDLNAVSYLADWIGVLYLGEIVEVGDSDDVYSAPSHPYTEALVSAIPIPDPLAAQKPIRLTGELPGPRSVPTGCRFHTRCPRKIGPICETEAPPFRDAGDGHFIRCHIPIDELARLQSAASAPTPEAT